MMKIIAAALAATLLGCACTAQAARDAGPASAGAAIPVAQGGNDAVAGAAATGPSNLAGSHWRFVEVAGQAVPAGVQATLRLAAGGHASGRTGCNAYGATYRVDADGTAHFQRGMATQMACLAPAGVMTVQRGIYAAFAGTTKVAVDAGTLTLLDAGGKPLARLVREPRR